MAGFRRQSFKLKQTFNLYKVKDIVLLENDKDILLRDSLNKLSIFDNTKLKDKELTVNKLNHEKSSNLFLIEFDN
jgi:hypothetical protein